MWVRGDAGAGHAREALVVFVVAVFNAFFLDNSISAAAVARVVHYTVSHEQLDSFEFDRELNCFS